VVGVGVGVGVGSTDAGTLYALCSRYALCAGPGSTHMNAMLQADEAGVQCSRWLLLRRALHSPQAGGNGCVRPWHWVGVGVGVGC
jgi:hypothetical protein